MSEQVSTEGHVLESQLQLPQLPPEGPLELPELHVPVAAHQPHGYAPVHDAQSECVAHASTGALHSKLSHDQSPPHVPLVGPLEVPLRHAPSQKPQPARAVHASHVVALAQGSVGPVH